MLRADLVKLYEADKRWKSELLAAITDATEVVKRHFDVVADNSRHALMQLNAERLAHMDRRIQRLERKPRRKAK